jgi:hypothetical protein
MRPYIVNLTNNLIGKNRFDRVPMYLPGRPLIEWVKEELQIGDVADMSPETLGRIMGSLQIGDVMASKAELLGDLHFGGDCEGMLRELVAICLAYAIAGRLESAETRMKDIPAYRHAKETRIGSHK